MNPYKREEGESESTVSDMMMEARGWSNVRKGHEPSRKAGRRYKLKKKKETHPSLKPLKGPPF